VCDDEVVVIEKFRRNGSGIFANEASFDSTLIFYSGEGFEGADNAVACLLRQSSWTICRANWNIPRNANHPAKAGSKSRSWLAV
jgi:hypothetical protein